VPRPPRHFEPGSVYHLTSHGIDDRPIVRDDVDRQLFALRLLRVAVSHAWRLFAACLMDTHHHLVLQAPGVRISDGMKLLNGGHSRAFNARHRRRGALFEARYRDREIRDDRHLEEAIRYVECNAVSAGVVDGVAEWPWSTHTASPFRALLRPCLTSHALPTPYERGTFPCRTGSIVCPTPEAPEGETR
jgi:REP element-mobilizing transposase RayT